MTIVAAITILFLFISFSFLSYLNSRFDGNITDEYILQIESIPFNDLKTGSIQGSHDCFIQESTKKPSNKLVTIILPDLLPSTSISKINVEVENNDGKSKVLNFNISH